MNNADYCFDKILSILDLNVAIGVAVCNPPVFAFNHGGVS